MGSESVIKAHEGQRVHNAMIDQLVQQEVIRIMAEREREEAEKEAEREREIQRLRVELELRRKRDPRIYTALIRDARHRYWFDPGSQCFIARAWWALVGWTVLGFWALLDRMGV